MSQQDDDSSEPPSFRTSPSLYILGALMGGLVGLLFGCVFPPAFGGEVAFGSAIDWCVETFFLGSVGGVLLVVIVNRFVKD